jgi:hypothetical protein
VRRVAHRSKTIHTILSGRETRGQSGVAGAWVRVPAGSGQPPMIIKTTFGGRQGKKNPK